MGDGRLGVDVVAAMLAFNYFFCSLWAAHGCGPTELGALAAFLMTAIVGSQLSSRIRKAADVATDGEKRSNSCMPSARTVGRGNVIQLLNAIPITSWSPLKRVRKRLPCEKQKFYRSGHGTLQLEEEQLRRRSSGRAQLMPQKASATHDSIGHPFDRKFWRIRRKADAADTGGCRHATGIAIERARAVEQLTKTEADRQSERLKSALLDSIRNFRTPLTSIKASVTHYSRNGRQGEQGQELLQIMMKSATG